MRKRFLIISFLLLCSGTVIAQFNGGQGDGYADEVISSTTLENISVTILYMGNSGDGYSNEILSSTTLSNVSLEILYVGGNGDGYADDLLSSTTLENVSLEELYAGGNGDGYSGIILASTTLENISLEIVYTGGNGDGYANEILASTTLDNISLAILYVGGNGDGYADDLLSSTTLENTSLAILYSGGNGDGFSSDQESVFLDPNLIVDLRINIKVFIQGPLLNPINPGLMNDILRVDGKIPTMSPYSDLSVINSSVLNDGGTSGNGLSINDIVDWVWIEIRSGIDNTLIVDDKSALLQRDGDIVDLDGLSNIFLEGFIDPYYVVVKHRNHLGVMTQNPVNLSVTPTNIDFTLSGTPTFGSNAQVTLSSGSSALWAGDTNNNGQIKFLGSLNSVDVIKDYILADPTNFLNFITYSSLGYLNVDVDLNGIGKFSGANDDSNIIKDNILQHPGNILNFPTFSINTTVPEEN